MKNEVTVLIVEEEHLVLELLTKAVSKIENFGRLRILPFTKAEEALKIMPPVYPDLIIIGDNTEDSEMNGYELCKLVKSHEYPQDIPILLLTEGLTDLDRYYEIGVTENLDKPFSITDLFVKVTQILRAKETQEYLISELENKELEINGLSSEIITLRERLLQLEEFKIMASEKGGVFISYSQSDKGIVDKITDRFESDNIHYWRDEKDLLIGQVIDKAISEGIQRSWFFLVLITPNSIHSKWVEREFDEASHEEIEGKKIILPVIGNGMNPSELPARLRRRAYADLNQDFEYGYDKLKRSIYAYLEKFNTDRNH